MATKGENDTARGLSGSASARAIGRVSVLGAGTMGHGIAQLAAQAGCEVVIRDVEQKFLDAGLEKVKWSLGKLVEKNRITREQADLVLRRLKWTTDLKSAVSESDLVIEAVPEELRLKKEAFASIDKHAPEGTIFASNTSSLPIDEMAGATSRPQKVIGVHFFNPPQLMPLVEIILGSETAVWVLRTVEGFAKRLGKETIICRKYVPGFVVNNILGALNRVPMTMLERGEGSAEEIDSALKFRAGFPMGVFELQDYSGIDVGYNVQKVFESQGYPGEVSSPLKQLVEQGRLGAKTGRGFYEWKGGQRPKISADAGEKVDIIPIIASGVSAAAELIRQGVATQEDVDKGIRLGLGFPKGILEMGDEIGLDKLLDSLEAFNAKHGQVQRKPSPLLVELVMKNQLGKKTGKGFHDYQKTPGEANFETILLDVETDTGIAWLTLNRPQRLNTITPTMMGELSEALNRLWKDERVRVLVIRGAGERAFSAGADVTSFQSISLRSMMAGSLRGGRVYGMLEAFPHPVVAAIRGYCREGGASSPWPATSESLLQPLRSGSPRQALG